MSGFSSLEGAVVGVAVGGAGAAAVEPVLAPAAQQAWKESLARINDLNTLARLVAQGLVSIEDLVDEAKRNGFTEARLRQRVQLQLMAAPVSELLQLWRRGEFGDPGSAAAHEFVNHGLAKAQIEPQYWAAIKQLFHERLSVSDIANAVQQGHMPNDGVLPDISAAIVPAFGYSQPPSPDGEPASHVPLTQIPIDPLLEARAHGFDEDRLKVAANLAGLPPGPEELLAMWNRSLIDEASVDAGIREGHMKTKWAQAFKRMRWHVLSAPEYAALWLRGWITKAEAITGGALTGATPEQMDLLYKNRGRPMAPVQAFTAWARKAPHPVGEGIPARPGTFDFEDFKRAIQQSDIRTEYVEPLWDIRYAYPSLFQLNRLVLAHAITAVEGANWAEKQRYAPEVITALVKFWNQSTPATADANEKKAETQLWTTTHRSYIATESGDAEARERFALLNIPGAAQTRILQLWASERGLIRAQLSPADIRKAYQQGDVNAATGTAWTHDDAIAAFLDRGWSMTDAESYLVIPYKG